VPVPTNALRLEFVRAAWDTLASGAVVLDRSVGTTYLIRLRWMPIAESWYLTMLLTSGLVVVSGAALRDRTDCLMGVSTPGRPAGALISYDPKASGDPTLASYSRGGAGLYYLPDGFDPTSFSLYRTEVA
jgi:hypothetical protein